jgi:hypothetical protein
MPMFPMIHVFKVSSIRPMSYLYYSIYIYYTVHIDIFLVSFSCDYPSIIALATSSLCCSSLLGPILTSGLWLPAGWMWRPCLQIGFRNGSICHGKFGDTHNSFKDKTMLIDRRRQRSVHRHLSKPF